MEDIKAWTGEQYALIETHYPKALMNPGDEYRNSAWIRYDLHGVLGLCGCGIPEESAAWLLSLLKMIGSKRESPEDYERYCEKTEEVWGDTPDAMRYLILYWIDDRGWTEHGGNVRGCWLQEKGRAAMVALEMLIDAERLED